MKIADVAIRRPVFAVMLIGAFVVFGLFSYPRVGVDLFPNVEFPVVTVTVVYPGADPASMESKVADPIEEAVNTMAGIKILRSVNLESVSQILVQFELDVDAAQAAQDIRDRLSAIEADLPSGIEPPVVQKFDVGAEPIMSIALSSDRPPRELTKIADEVVKERIQRLRGVGSVELVGDREREIHVLIDPAKLAGVGFAVADVANALQAQNLELPAGRVEEGLRELTVKTKGEVRSTDEIADIIISGLGGAVIRVGDVASVVDGTEEARSWSSMNGVSAVALVIRKQSGSNTVAVARDVRAELAELAPRVEREGVRIAVPSDTSTYVERVIEDVKFDIVFGALLAVIIILFFLHDFRATLISAVAIPSALIAAVAFIDFMGFTFNQMTMLALSLSVGILIDDAIVVVENIYRHFGMGKPARVAASEGTHEIGLAVLATTATIVAVFIPVAFMKGIIGRFFFQFGLTVAFAVSVSTLVSLTLTPMLSSRLLRLQERPPNIVFRLFGRGVDALNSGYRVLLGAALRHRLITLLVAFVSLVGALAMIARVDAEFIPPEDRAEFNVFVEVPNGTSLGQSKRFVEAVAADLRANGPGVTGTFVTVGGGARAEVNKGKLLVKMTPAAEREFHQEDAMAWVRDRFADVERATVTVTPVAMMGGDSGFRQQAMQFNIRGRDSEEIAAAADRMVEELSKVEGLVDLDTTNRGGKPELAVEIKRDRAAALGVPVAAIATTIRALVAGDKVTELKDGLDIYDVTIELPESDKAGFEGLANMKVRSTTGQLIDLSSVVSVDPTVGPAQIERQARQRQITVLANLEGLPLGEAIAAVDAAAARVVPDHLTTDYAGMAEVMGESFKYMVLALLLAIIFVYMLLAAQFNSFIHPFTIMLSLPLSVVGAFGALYLSGMTLSIFSMIGVIMLMGLVTKNGILLVDYTNTLRARGLDTREALLEAGPVRLRPILMTSAAMIFGMLPVALAVSEGGEVRAPMAMAVIGGLITSTLLTLVVVPVVYSLLDGLAQSRLVRWIGGRVFSQSAEAGEAPEARDVSERSSSDAPG